MTLFEYSPTPWCSRKPLLQNNTVANLITRSLDGKIINDFVFGRRGELVKAESPTLVQLSKQHDVFVSM